jgi:hypothetical protein
MTSQSTPVGLRENSLVPLYSSDLMPDATGTGNFFLFWGGAKMGTNVFVISFLDHDCFGQ